MKNTRSFKKETSKPTETEKKKKKKKRFIFKLLKKKIFWCD